MKIKFVLFERTLKIMKNINLQLFHISHSSWDIYTYVLVMTQEQAKTYIYLKRTKTGENKNQPTKPQMTSKTSITQLKTPILYQKTFLKKLTIKNFIERNH